MAEKSFHADQRRLAILARLREDLAVSVNELARELNASKVTIRRDLDALSAANLIRRVHGGAVRAGASIVAAEPAPLTRAHVGVIVPTASYYFSDVLQTCKSTLDQRGITISIVSSNYDTSREQAACANFVDAGVQAIICAPSFTDSASKGELERWLFALPVPVILLEREVIDDRTGRTFSSVRTAYERGWELGLRRMRELGHRRVALVSHGLRQVGVHLEERWLAAASDAGFSAEDVPMIVDPRLTRSPAPAVLERVAERIESAAVSGVICHCDVATLDLVSALVARGATLPRDLSIVANEDQIAQLTNPPLSSISPVKDALGATVARLVIDAVDDPGAPIQRVLIEPSFTDRGSLQPPSPTPFGAGKRPSR